MRRFIDLANALMESYSKVQSYLDKGKIPRFLNGLVAEARKAGSYETFRLDYLNEIKHGFYWHVTEHSNFTIDPHQRGPRDMSSMSNGQETANKLMVTTHLKFWTEYYGDGRPYAALIDMSAVPRQSYRQVNRGFGNEFWVDDPSKATVVSVMPVAKALRLNKQWRDHLPGSEEQLRQFYEIAIRDN